MSTLDQDIYAPATQNHILSAHGVLILTADKVEDLEFFYPYYRFIEAGFRVDVVTPSGGKLTGKHGLELQNTLKLGDVKDVDYALLYIPGGKAPEQLKNLPEALQLVKAFDSNSKLISSICHGPQILAAADIIRGRRIAGWPEISDEIEKAGATYVNEETVMDGLFITARWPGDLPSHLKHTLKALHAATMTDDHSIHAAA